MAWASEQNLLHPDTGGVVFGQVPELKIHRGPTFPAGAIHLKYGEHRGPHRGFGFQHIWQEHYSDITNHDDAMDTVIRDVAKALQPRAPIFYDTGDRLEVLRFTSNSIIIEWNRRTLHYSVVTAGFVRKNAKGSRVGALCLLNP